MPLRGRVVPEPHNLAPTWVGFDFEAAFGCPVKLVVVTGGGNAKKLKGLPPGCRAGDNANALVGGFRLWTKGAANKALRSGKARV